MDELSRLDGLGQADLVARGEVKPAELVEAALERLEKVESQLQAIAFPMADLALEAAAQVDPAAPLAGVPFLLKDLAAEYAGVPFREGSAFLEGLVPDEDQELVVRQKRAGLVTIAKTKTPEFGIVPLCEPELYGPVHNPWDVERSTGGSSGGSSALVAARVVPAAHANDAGGSIRIPAAWCGLFGLKPTRGRNPLGPRYGDVFGGLVAEHAVSVSVRDSAAILDATSGPGLGDPYQVSLPRRPFLDEVGADPGRLRIALTTAAPGGVPVEDVCRDAAVKAAEVCEALGHDMEEVELDVDWPTMQGAIADIYISGAAWVAEHWGQRLGRQPEASTFEPLTWAMIEEGRKIGAARYLLAVERLQHQVRRLARALAPYDVWLTPTTAVPPVRIGEVVAPSEQPLAFWFAAAGIFVFTQVANGSGQPAMSVPLSWTPDGLPVGAHFVGRFGDEATLFRLAGQLEQARPWADRLPPVHA